MINYIPKYRDNPTTIDVTSAWGDIPTILKSIIIDFDLKTDKALEFGVEYGYSTSALANYFSHVIGVDTFEGDIHSGLKDNHYEKTKKNLLLYENIELIKSDYKHYIIDNSGYYDLIHIDIIHTYEDTFKCGEWAVQNSKCVVFHDTMLFEPVYNAVRDLSIKYNLKFYNYPKSYGLGILIKK